jgi:hypothetical protein
MNPTYKKGDKFYNYHIGDGLEEYTLCQYELMSLYSPNRVDGIVTWDALNYESGKISVVSEKQLDKEFSRTPFGAAILFKGLSDFYIEGMQKQISERQKFVTKELQRTVLLQNFCNQCSP